MAGAFWYSKKCKFSRSIISRLFVQEVFLKEKSGCKQKGAKKEPKRSQKRQDILHRMKENPAITQIKIMKELEFSKKQQTDALTS